MKLNLNAISVNTNRMDISIYESDLITELAENAGLKNLAPAEKLKRGILRHSMTLSDEGEARRLGRSTGRYVTYDCTRELYSDNRAAAQLEEYLAYSLKELFTDLPKSADILVIGLGNVRVAADSLGGRSAARIAVGEGLRALTPGVYGETGIEASDIAEAIADKTRPDGVIIIDSLATSSAVRLGCSYQLTDAGIAPASGVGRDRKRIDAQSLGLPVVAVGVPLALNVRALIADFIKEYLAAIDCEANENVLALSMREKKLSSLIVAPKEIGFLAEACSLVIANAVNLAFSN